MLKEKYILTIDEGTTQCKCALWDETGKMQHLGVEEMKMIRGMNGEIEMEPFSIVNSVKQCINEVLQTSGCDPAQITSIGLTNQRETSVIWDRNTGQPLYNAIVWQDRRGEAELGKLQEESRNHIKSVTGLVPDPYFSVSKIRWMLENTIKGKNIDDLIFGTVDTWLIWNMSIGHRHITDPSNASRTMIYDINHLEWSVDLTESFHIPESLLPEVVDSAAPELALIDVSGSQIPLNSIAGDQQASLFGHQAFLPGDSKCTYGTGSFVLVNTGDSVSMKQNILTSIGWKLHGSPAIYCNEGSAFNTGSIIKWIRDNLGIIDSSGSAGDVAMKSSPDHGLIFVPALSGLGAPFWLPSAKGTIFGITGKTSKYDLVRSALEAIAFRIRDIIGSMDGGSELRDRIRVDGGPTTNNFLMQFQADILNMDVYRSANSEMTSAGVAYMSGLSDGMWSYDDIKAMSSYLEPLHPGMDRRVAERLYENWKKAVESVLRHYTS
ncbi:MAG: hypothetical protein B2I17_00400 [Thermoplasmatales archaeon B_DKE]|nr:MAG: hypothetical protein B2I17_00400 [Thermoplasmatales archaeon B_DKE]